MSDSIDQQRSSQAVPNNPPTSQSRDNVFSVLACAFVVAVLLSLAGYAVDGKTGAEKTVTKLVLPVGATWLLLSGWVLRRLIAIRFRQAALPGLLWLGFTLCSTPPLVDWCTYYLETRETSFDPLTDPPLDALVVLGGGTSQGPSRAEVDESGDRVVYAAQLYVQGHTKELITTGNALFTGGGSNLSEQTTEIWTQLGIPASVIRPLGGSNTYQELQAVKAAMQHDLAGKRIGVLTSAWHLARAMRLARAAGLPDLVPVAADHQWSDLPKPFADYVPRAEILARFSRCQHEFMARLVQR